MALHGFLVGIDVKATAPINASDPCKRSPRSTGSKLISYLLAGVTIMVGMRQSKDLSKSNAQLTGVGWPLV
jgi:hypothetical protein